MIRRIIKRFDFYHTTKECISKAIYSYDKLYLVLIEKEIVLSGDRYGIINLRIACEMHSYIYRKKGT